MITDKVGQISDFGSDTYAVFISQEFICVFNVTIRIKSRFTRFIIDEGLTVTVVILINLIPSRQSVSNSCQNRIIRGNKDGITVVIEETRRSVRYFFFRSDSDSMTYDILLSDFLE